MYVVVKYLFSTSNHNLSLGKGIADRVVKYLFSTSNHNSLCPALALLVLSNIFFLHQTTTASMSWRSWNSCQISFFYIKPQQRMRPECVCKCCQISFFYIKPQPLPNFQKLKSVVKYLFSTSNHNQPSPQSSTCRVVKYLFSTSNHN